ncbi:MAG: nucleotidyltransferase [Clostridia bacterium]|nr:nucleotidyltransferase [Clostridia bacterium]
MTLIILAAGMGSRYGGLKQIDPITKEGDFIIDFSVFDAIRNGFDKVVFVIKEEHLELFKETIGSRFEGKVKVEYAFQRLTDLPEGFTLPEGRTKPWGTTQAVLAAKELVNEPFCVLNADDFYGESAYRLVASHFTAPTEDYCMVGYRVGNTLTDHGTVSRGVCEVSEEGYLQAIVERTAISRDGEEAVFEADGKEVRISLTTPVSMNFWGFTPKLFGQLEQYFVDFLSNLGDNPLKCECYLPMAVGELMAKGECRVRVYESEDAWYGVTYSDDKPKVKASLEALKEAGVYPEKLS